MFTGALNKDAHVSRYPVCSYMHAYQNVCVCLYVIYSYMYLLCVCIRSYVLVHVCMLLCMYIWVQVLTTFPLDLAARFLWRRRLLSSVLAIV